MLDFSVSRTGGINLNTGWYKASTRRGAMLLPGLPLYYFESYKLDEDAYDNLAQQRCEDFTRH